jgi:hypothetical protein
LNEAAQTEMEGYSPVSKQGNIFETQMTTGVIPKKLTFKDTKPLEGTSSFVKPVLNQNNLTVHHELKQSETMDMMSSHTSVKSIRKYELNDNGRSLSHDGGILKGPRADHS